MAYKSPKPLPTREPAGQGGGPGEKGQQQERGTQHTGLATVSVQGPGAEAPAQAALETSRWAGGPVLGWATTSEGRERGWQTEGTPEPLPKACQGLKAPLPRDLQLLGGGRGDDRCPFTLLAIGLLTTNTTYQPKSCLSFPSMQRPHLPRWNCSPIPLFPQVTELTALPPTPPSQATPCQGPGHTTDSVEEKGGVLFSSA